MIQHSETSSKGVYFILLESGNKAEMTYSKAGESMIIIDHTSVPEEAKGMGFGKKLVNQAVEDARSKGLKIIPLCPFAKSLFEKLPEWRDVLN